MTTATNKGDISADHMWGSLQVETSYIQNDDPAFITHGSNDAMCR